MDYTLIGTTDVDHQGSPEKAVCSPEEQAYLLNAASEYFQKQLSDNDVVWTFSGVRPLYDDNASSATAATRDYVLKTDDEQGQSAVLNVFGGKITTYRKLAEAALVELQKYHPNMQPPWTAGVSLPGGHFKLEDIPSIQQQLKQQYPFMSDTWVKRMIRTYGVDTFEMFGNAASIDELGMHFGATLTEAEVTWQIEKEFAMTVEDIVWRRTKLGLRLSQQELRDLDTFLTNKNMGLKLAV